MRNLVASSLLLVTAIVFARNGIDRRAIDDSALFEPLFDGATLTGWRGDPRYWSVEAGTITGRTSAAAPLERNTFLIHDDVFGDFELRLRYRIRGGNSGIQYRSRDRGAFEVSGYQADIDAGPNYTGILYEERGRGILALRGQAPNFAVDGARDDALPIGKSAPLQTFISGQDWNDYVVIARGSRLIHRVNGVTMIDVIDRDEGARAIAGHLALQLHQGPPMEVQFKDIRIRMFDADSAAPEPDPEWIWAAGEQPADDSVVLERTFESRSEVRQARLTVAADNRHVTRVNGRVVGKGDDWGKPDAIDVTRALHDGTNVVEIAATNAGGPAAVFATLELELATGDRAAIVSDGSWTARRGRERPAPAVSFGPVRAPRGPWPAPPGLALATPASAIVVPAGFTVERLVSARARHGSWVVLCFDPKGRLIVSPQYGGLLRITLPTKPGRVALIEPLDITLGSAQGLLWAHRSLYVVVNGEVENGGGVWRCRDEDQDDRFESVDRIFACGPGGEHGPHGICVGPDERLYVALGNHVTDLADGQKLQTGTRTNAAVFAATSPLTNFDEDMTLPRAWDPNGHAVGIVAPGGVVVRMRPDGSDPEMFAGGFRNAYDLALSADGELFTYDSDMEWDIGLPWYRPTRVCHVVSGADFGWRSGSGTWPQHWFDSLGAVVDIGVGSPTGVAFASASNWPAPWRDQFLIADWTYGRIHSVTMQQNGATFSGHAETFAQGRPLNVTDLAFGPNGALYVVTGGRGTQSGLYRVATDSPQPMSARKTQAAVPPAVARRHAIEALQTSTNPADVPTIVAALDDEDAWVRYAARIALEHRAVLSWRDLALAEARPRARFEALLALARCEPTAIDAIAASLARMPFATTDASAALRETRLLAVALARGGVPVDATKAALLQRLDAAFPCGAFDLDRDLHAVLVVLGAPLLHDRVVGLLERTDDVAQRVWWAWVLRDAQPTFDETLRARFVATVERLRGASGGYSFAGYLGAVLPARIEAPPVTPLAAPPAVATWSVDRLMPEMARLDAGRSFDRGSDAFRAARCAECHRIAGVGGGIGPDLTGAAGRFARRDLLEAILEPSKVVSDQYALTEFVTHDGKVVTGRLISETPKRYVVVTDAVTGARQDVLRESVKLKRPVTTSPMPEHLLDPLDLDAILDLLAFVESGGDRNSPAFAK